MKYGVYGISFGNEVKPGTFENTFIVRVVEEHVDECRAYAKQLGLKEVLRGPLYEETSPTKYQQYKEEGFMKYFLNNN